MTRREQIVAYIRDYWQRNGYAPTFREIGEGVGYRTNSSVVYSLLKLRAEGVLAYEDGKSRTVRLV